MSLFGDVRKKHNENAKIDAALKDNKLEFTDVNNNKVTINSRVFTDKPVLFLTLQFGKKPEENKEIAISEEYIEFLITVLETFKRDGNILKVIKTINELTNQE